MLYTCTSSAKRVEGYPICCQHENLNIAESKKSVDKRALELMPSDLDQDPSKMMPVQVVGDGNCLARCGSLLAFGFEDEHTEIRVRIVMQQVLNKSSMLSNRYLSAGFDKRINHVGIYTMYSDEYKVGKKLDQDTITSVYETEVLKVAKEGAWMGVWQLHALAAVLKYPVYSVYPEYGGQTVRCNLNRKMMPACESTTKKPAFIMWTNVHGKEIKEALWAPNHFVVLLPIDREHHLTWQNDTVSIQHSPYLTKLGWC